MAPKATDAQGNEAEPVMRTNDHHAPNETTPSNVARPPMPGDAGVTPAGPSPGEAATVETAPAENVGPTVDVEAIAEFWNDGELRRVGDKFSMPIARAREAGMYVRGKDDDGKRISVAEAIRRVAPDTTIRRADLAGRPKHERIGELKNEEAQLEQRLDQVRAQIKSEGGEAPPTKAEGDAK